MSVRSRGSAFGISFCRKAISLSLISQRRSQDSGAFLALQRPQLHGSRVRLDHLQIDDRAVPAFGLPHRLFEAPANSPDIGGIVDMRTTEPISEALSRRLSSSSGTGVR